jgi:hypothetical protein
VYDELGIYAVNQEYERRAQYVAVAPETEKETEPPQTAYGASRSVPLIHGWRHALKFMVFKRMKRRRNTISTGWSSLLRPKKTRPSQLSPLGQEERWTTRECTQTSRDLQGS